MDKCYDATRHGGGKVMGGYRLYFMDRFSGHIDHRRDFVADSDAHAVEIATGWFAGNPMELWSGGTKLERWEAQALTPLITASSAPHGE